jgi:hypothetical protein
MNRPENALWPFSTRAALVAVPMVLLALAAVIVVTRVLTGWPDSASGRLVVIGAFAFSLIPVLLALADALMRQGASVEFKGVKLNLASIPPCQHS